MLQSDFPDFVPLEEEQEESLRRRKKYSSFEKWQNFISYFPIAGWVINWVTDVVRERIMQVKRRRRSYKLALFFQAQMILGLIGFLIFLIVGLQDLSLMKDNTRVEPECALPTSLTAPGGTVVAVYDSNNLVIPEVLFNYTAQYRKTVRCTNEKSTNLDAACDLGGFKLLNNLMIVTAVFFLLGMIVSWLVSSGFKFFSNIPMEALNIEGTSCKVTFLGTMCRYGPWLGRTLTVVNLGLVLALVCLPTVGNICAGSIALTHSCLNMFDDCAEQQFLNCRYYYSSNCVGAYLPHPESSNVKSEFEKCKNPDFAKKFSGRFDARIVFPSPCTRCWALHSDCLDVETNRVRFGNNQTTDEFVYKNSAAVAPVVAPASDLANVMYCNCIQQLDAVNANVDIFNITRLVGNETVCPVVGNYTNRLTLTTCPSDLLQPIPPAVTVDESANIFSPQFTDAVLGLSLTQECGWAPDNIPSYFYDSDQCSQAGSALSRFVFVTSYVTVTLMGLLLIAGISVRHTVRPETWSYSPQNPNEAWFWKALRSIGPG
jgi:hypothetical protein